MPRIKLAEQSLYPHHLQLKVRVTDVNYGGHLGNDAVAGLLQQARIETLALFSASEMNLGDGKTGLIQTDAAIVYAGEAFMLDLLTIETAFAEMRGSTFRMCHRIRRGEDLIALAELGFAGYDYGGKRMSPLPKALVHAVMKAADA